MAKDKNIKCLNCEKDLQVKADADFVITNQRPNWRICEIDGTKVTQIKLADGCWGSYCAECFSTIKAAKLTKATGNERNDPCPCGSGKKYKKCCQAKE